MISQSMPRRDSEDFGEQILTKVVKAAAGPIFSTSGQRGATTIF